MEKKKRKRMKIMLNICSAFVLLWAILGLINAFHVISLPKTAVIVLDGLAICVIIGLYCLNLKKLSDEFGFVGLFHLPQTTIAPPPQSIPGRGLYREGKVMSSIQLLEDNRYI